MINKPRVDWLEIVNRCKARFQDRFPCEARTFGFEQVIKFTASQMIESQNIHKSGQIGHKVPRKQHAHYYPPTDLSCDDPYYDGVPVIDI